MPLSHSSLPSSLNSEQVRVIKAEFDKYAELKHKAVLGHISTLMHLARIAGVNDYCIIQRELSKLI